MSGQPVSIMVEGVQVTLPSYEEAVSGGGASASSESRVQIVLSEGQHATTPEAGPSRPSSLKQQQQQSEMAVVHPVPPSSSSSPSPSPSPSSSAWVLEHAGAVAPSSSHRRPSAGSDQHSFSLDSEMDYSDGKQPPLIHINTPVKPQLSTDENLSVICRYAITEGGLREPLNSLKTTSVATDLCWWSGMPLESLSAQLSTQTSRTEEAPDEAVCACVCV